MSSANFLIIFSCSTATVMSLMKITDSSSLNTLPLSTPEGSSDQVLNLPVRNTLCRSSLDIPWLLFSSAVAGVKFYGRLSQSLDTPTIKHFPLSTISVAFSRNSSRLVVQDLPRQSCTGVGLSACFLLGVRLGYSVSPHRFHHLATHRGE